VLFSLCSSSHCRGTAHGSTLCVRFRSVLQSRVVVQQSAMHLLVRLHLSVARPCLRIHASYRLCFRGIVRDAQLSHLAELMQQLSTGCSRHRGANNRQFAKRANSGIFEARHNAPTRKICTRPYTGVGDTNG
jgi:hypothetical protein